MFFKILSLFSAKDYIPFPTQSNSWDIALNKSFTHFLTLSNRFLKSFATTCAESESPPSSLVKSFLLCIFTWRAFEQRGLAPSHFKPIHLSSNAAQIHALFNAMFERTQLQFFQNWSLDQLEQLLDRFPKEDAAQLNFEITPELPGIFYEQLIGQEAAKKEGIFYTPITTVRSIVERTLSPRENHITRHTKNFHVLDPACGGGAFLLEAFRFLAKAHRLSSDDRQDLCDVVEQSLFGIDRDPLAVEVSKLSILLEIHNQQQQELFQQTSLRLPAFNLICANSLLDDTDLPEQLPFAERAELAPFSLQQAFPQVESKGFHAIIGNPPYGLARGEQISKSENNLLLKRYAPYRDGKLNKYLLFMAKGYELLQPAGRLSYIVPNSWLGIRAGRKLREIFLENAELESIEVVGDSVFRDPSLECVIFTIEKNANKEDFRIASANASFRVSHKACLRLPDAIIPLRWSKDIEGAFEKIHAHSTPLDSHPLGFKPLIALQAYSAGKGKPAQSKQDVKEHIYHAEFRETEDHWPYYEGRDIMRYANHWSGSYLKHGEWLAEPQVLARFQGPRVAIREITAPYPNSLISTYIEDTALYNKSVLHVLPAEKGPLEQNKSQKMKALLGILNSRLASFVLSIQGRKIQRKLFPKIVNDDLKDFPLPNCLEENVEALSNLVTKRLNLGQTQTDAIQKMEERIEKKVCEMYGIDSSISEIASTIA